jgi:hypothetical protein
MKASVLLQRWATLSATLIALAACGGAEQLQISPPPNSQSWMARDAKTNDLLYVTDEGNYNVYVYAYPSGTPMGTINSAYGSPTGLCVDKKGNVFITEYNGQEVLEYAHGGTNPIASLYDPGQPIGCSIDPKTGNLAVANEMDVTGGYGNVTIFAKAKGNGQVLQDLPSLELPYWCSYDDHGNLFIDGEYIQSGFHFSFAELPAGSSNFTEISVPDGAGTPPGGVQWDGKYVTLGSASSQNGLIFQFKINGSSASLAGTTMLDGFNRMPTYFVVRQTSKRIKQGKRVIATSGGNIGFFKYPAGGSALTTITQNWPWSTVVSAAR